MDVIKENRKNKDKNLRKLNLWTNREILPSNANSITTNKFNS